MIRGSGPAKADHRRSARVVDVFAPAKTMSRSPSPSMSTPAAATQRLPPAFRYCKWSKFQGANLLEEDYRLIRSDSRVRKCRHSKKIEVAVDVKVGGKNIDYSVHCQNYGRLKRQCSRIPIDPNTMIGLQRAAVSIVVVVTIGRDYVSQGHRRLRLST